MKKESQFLALVLTQWNYCKSSPAICKRIMLAGKTFRDDLTAKIVRALICTDGDWRAAAEMVARCRGADLARIKKFQIWAKKITAPRKRGLMLDWKGDL